MATLRIDDLNPVLLGADLCDLLDRTLAPGSLRAAWTLSPIDVNGYLWFDALDDAGGQCLEAMVEAGKPVSGTALAAAARVTRQIVWGRFAARLPAAPDRDWLVIRAMDSTFCDITTEDAAVIGRIKASFAQVRIVGDISKPDQPFQARSDRA